MKNQFTISSSYQWPIDGKKSSLNNSEKAIKSIARMIKERFSNNENGEHNYNINYRRLRASAGKTIIESILNRIIKSQVLIIDITENNRNVFIEAGIAIALAKQNQNLSVYFIKELIGEKSINEDIPSNLQGYFISGYQVDSKGNVVFKDSLSLRMSIEGDVKEYFNSLENIFESIDEIN